MTTTSGSVIATDGEQFALSSLFDIASGSASIILQLNDDNQYSAPQAGNYGYFSGNGHTLSLSPSSEIDIYRYAVFDYDASTGQYINSLLGNLSAVTYVSAGGTGHNETVSLTTQNGDTTALCIATGASPTTLSGATPNAISTIAQSYVGQTWNSEGCWLLATDISARAGASLPITSDALSPPSAPVVPVGNGEWIVAYNGETQANPTIASAEAMARPGDVIDITWADGTNGHVTTVVSGFGVAAQVIDNWNFGSNVVSDGTGDDLSIYAAHSLDEVLTGNVENGKADPAIPASIQIYRLDTPTISVLNVASALGNRAISLSPLFSTQDAGGAGTLPITEFAFYDVGTGGAAADRFTLDGATTAAHDASHPFTISAAALPGLTLLTGGSAGADSVYVSAYNGNYWGDWAAISVTVTGAPSSETASQALLADSAGALAQGVSLADSAVNVLASLDGLEGLVARNEIAGITLTDGGTPNLSVTAAQFAADQTALNAISSTHSVTVDYSGTAAQHDFSGSDLNGATALQFSDQTIIVAAAPGPANDVTSGNITELYAAIFSREPDVGGLAFYQANLQKNPATALQTFADYFLNSAEYKSSHIYPAGTAGDTQFIEDSYQNLLHRTPSADEVNFYLTKVMTKPDAHALMLVYFSASAEFLGDVQITAQNPASAQHWLLLS